MGIQTFCAGWFRYRLHMEFVCVHSQNRIPRRPLSELLSRDGTFRFFLSSILATHCTQTIFTQALLPLLIYPNITLAVVGPSERIALVSHRPRPVTVQKGWWGDIRWIRSGKPLCEVDSHEITVRSTVHQADSGQTIRRKVNEAGVWKASPCLFQTVLLSTIATWVAQIYPMH